MEQGDWGITRRELGRKTINKRRSNKRVEKVDRRNRKRQWGKGLKLEEKGEMRKNIE